MEAVKVSIIKGEGGEKGEEKGERIHKANKIFTGVTIQQKLRKGIFFPQEDKEIYL